MIAVQSEVDGTLRAAKRARLEQSETDGTFRAAKHARLEPLLPASTMFLLAVQQHKAQMEALVQIRGEKFTAALKDVVERQITTTVAAAGGVWGRRLAEKEEELGEARRRKEELTLKVRQLGELADMWFRLAKQSEQNAIVLNEELSRAVASPGAADEGSCCYDDDSSDGSGTSRGLPCRGCGEGDVCVLLLPCRHVCLCAACQSKLASCPVCSCLLNATLRVYLE